MRRGSRGNAERLSVEMSPLLAVLEEPNYWAGTHDRTTS